MGAASAEVLQPFQVAFNKRLLLCVAPVLELPLAVKRLGSRLKTLGIHQMHWTVLECVCRAATCVVCIYTLKKFPCRPYVEAIIRAAKDVDVVHGPFDWKIIFSRFLPALTSSQRL